MTYLHTFFCGTLLVTEAEISICLLHAIDISVLSVHALRSKFWNFSFKPNGRCGQSRSFHAVKLDYFHGCFTPKTVKAILYSMAKVRKLVNH